eukprot:scaffold106_cov380-Prasinococcus_capsulatus_cf.AAC.75
MNRTWDDSTLVAFRIGVVPVSVSILASRLPSSACPIFPSLFWIADQIKSSTLSLQCSRSPGVHDISAKTTSDAAVKPRPLSRSGTPVDSNKVHMAVLQKPPSWTHPEGLQPQREPQLLQYDLARQQVPVPTLHPH